MSDSRATQQRGSTRSHRAPAGALAMVVVLVVGVSWIVPAPAAAQRRPAVVPPQNGVGAASGGRAATWQARREEKRAHAVSAQGSSSFAVVGRWFSPEALREYYREDGKAGLGIVLGGRESGHGIQGGIRYSLHSLGKPLASRTSPNRMDASFRGLASVHGYRAAATDLSVNNLFGSSFSLEIGGTYERRLQETFYGLGPDSRPESGVAYGLAASRIGTELRWRAIPGLDVGAGIDAIEYSERPADDDRGDAVAGEPVALPASSGTVRYLRQRVFVELDRRDSARDPRRGAYLSVALEGYDDVDPAMHDFRRLAIDGRHHLSFLNGLRSIAVRGVLELTDVDDGATIPFYLQPSLGGPDDMRSFPAFRFRGANRLLLQTEYRWEAWRGLDMALFFDTGQVFDGFEEVGVDRLRAAYGLGFRFKIQETQLLRLDLAHGNEGFRTHVSLNRIF